MQIEKLLTNDPLRISKVSRKFPLKFAILLKCNFLKVSIVLAIYNKTLRLNNIQTWTAMNTKISAFVICVEA